MTLVSIARRAGLALVLAALPLVALAAEEKRLHVYNWSDYIAPDTIANFTKETGS
jgi:putrescine transport system substrate-binding protein